MEHFAIDLGGRESQICVRSSDGTIVREGRVKTAALPSLLATQPFSRVVVETCAEGFGIADAAIAHGHEVRVVPATLVRTLGVGARRTKTDRRDARVLSEVSTRIDLPSVHVPSHRARELKAICNARDVLVGARRMMINNVRGWLRTQLLRLRRGGASTVVERVREVCTPPAHIEQLLQMIDSLTEEIRESNRTLRSLVKQDDVAKRLQTAPGVGPVTTIRFVSTIDQIERFPSAHAVEAYLGLVPGEYSSSDTKHRLGITKAGSSRLRSVLIEAAWTLRRARPADPMTLWSYEVERRRGKNVAVVALARKLAGVLYAMWRDGTPYDPNPRRAKASVEFPALPDAAAAREPSRASSLRSSPSDP